ncbi:YqcC family protein [Rheinheimera sp. NSM]|uniref:YqcC family protein n=1 Tax=Rheinheimera sp. NSM TaxID=3457884 RepID=UPI004035D479
MSITDSFRKQSEKDKSVLSALDEIEAEMKRIGFWKESPPDVRVGSYLEAPSFELWLQCVFMPNARKAAQAGEYPSSSQVGLMAMREYDYHSCVEEALNLVSLLHDFDKLVAGK